MTRRWRDRRSSPSASGGEPCAIRGSLRGAHRDHGSASASSSPAGARNLQALIDACKAPDYPAEIVLVLSNVPGAQGLARAEAADIPGAHHQSQGLRLARRVRCRARPTLNAGRRRASLQCRLHAAAHRRLRRALVEPPSQHSPLAAARVQRACTPMRASLDEGVQDQRLHRAFRADGDGHGPDRGAGRRPGACRRYARQPRRPRARRPSIASIRIALTLVASGAVRVEGELVVGMTQISDQAPLFSPPFDEAL